MKLAQAPAGATNVFGIQNYMIVIGKDAPRHHSGLGFLKEAKERGLKARHTLHRMTDYWYMFETSR